MWKRITGCFAIVLLVIYLFFMYDETVLSGILVLVILYPVCACGFLLLCRKNGSEFEKCFPEIPGPVRGAALAEKQDLRKEDTAQIRRTYPARAGRDVLV